MKKLLLFLSFITVATGFAEAATIHVSITGNDTTGTGALTSPYATIQKAVDVSQDGDAILVAPGTYSGEGNRAINLLGKQITLRSMSGPVATVLDLGRQQGILALSTETLATAVDGFTFRNGYVESGEDWRGDGIISILGDAVMTLKNCIFTANETKATYVTTSTGIVVKRNRSYGATALVQNCLFYGNTIGGGGWTSVGGGSAFVVGATGGEPLPKVIDIRNCTIADNTLYSSATSHQGFSGGIRIAVLGAGVIESTIVWGNSSTFFPSTEWSSNSNYQSGAQTLLLGSVSYSISQNGIILEPAGSHEVMSWPAAVGSALTADPLFRNASAGDYSLSSDSPAIDAGNPATLDVDGTRSDIGFSLARAVFSSEGNLLANGSFENSAYMPGNTNTLDPSADGWSGSGNFQVMANGLNYEDAHQGQKSLVFNAGELTPSGSIEQTVGVLPSETYFLSFWLMHHGADSNTRPGTVGIKAEVLQNGAVVAESSIYLDTADGYNIGQWYPFSLQATSTASTMTVRFTDISTSGALMKDIGLDNVSLAPPDTDGDGVNDYREGKDGTDPNDPVSFNSLSKGLLAYYPFENGLLDESGYSKNLDQPGDHEFVADLTKNSGQALRSPSRVNGGVMSSKESGVSGNSPRTISFWFRSDGPQPWPAGNVILLGSRVAIDRGRGNIQIDNGYRNVETPSLESLHQRVNHFVWTYQNKLGDSRFYVNGQRVELVFEDGFGGPETTLEGVPDGPIKIMGGPQAIGFGDRGFQGEVDNARLYDRALTEAEVQQLYAAEAGDLDTDGDGLTDAWERGYGRYQVVQGIMTWDQAKADAEAKGGHLATITSQSEQDLIVSFFEPELREGRAGTWIGAYQTSKTDEPSGNWAWANGEAWLYTNWNVAPDNYQGDQDYGYIIGDNAGFSKWDDAPLVGGYTRYLLEFGYPTDPLNADTDGDGYNDKLETDAGTDPNDASSTPMVTVQGGTLPLSSGLAGTTVSTFSIGKYEVTWREWQEVRAWGVNNGYTDLPVAAGSSPNDPVRLVNQFDMVKWCNARSEKEGLTPVYLVNGQTYKVGMLYYSNIFSVNRFANGYRLPTEAEWEWAARGGVNSQGFTYSGSNDPDLVAWHRGNSSGAPVDLSEGRGSWPVGSKLANELGLHDMSGNVWEIVSLGGGWTFNRDERGGGWNHDALFSALAFRDMVIGLNVDQGNVDSGFRVVRSLDLLPPDADNDGVNDYRENADGTNPTDANSFNPLSRGLVAYYPLDGSSADESGLGNHAVNLGAEGTTDRFGANSRAYSFDGVSAYMDAPPLIADYQRNFTFSGWIRTTHVSSDRLDAAVSALCKTRDAGDFGGPAIDFREGKAVFTFNNNRVYGPLVPFEEWEHVTGDLVADGNWRHYIMSIDANGLITAFINGQQVASHQISTFLEVTGASPFQIGRAGGAHEAGRYFPGQIDEVRVYNRGLTGAEVWQIYQSEAANLDSDDDGLLDIHETQTGIFVSATDTGSDPYDSDSSDDGLLDGEVVTAGFNPNTSYTPLFNLVKSKSTGDQARIGLFTESAMIDLNLGGIVLRKSGSTVNLRLQIQSKTDLKAPHWTDEGTETFILDMPGNKAFMRIRALGPQ